MADLNELRDSLPIDQIAARLGEDPAAVRQAVDLALPALLGGMQANAQDPGGEESLARAVGEHDPRLVEGGVDLDDVDTGDGEKIARHIFGAQQEQVVNQLGSTGASNGLLQKLIPILAPIVLAYLAKQVGGKQGAAGGGVLGTILSTILAGAAQGSGGSTRSGDAFGGILGDLLGGLLGGGRKS